MMLELQEAGCHNINFVTPEHVVPQILEALVLAVQAGLRVPLVYNTSAYDSLESLRWLDGVVDIYMPDFKFWDDQLSFRYLKAKNYPRVARKVLAEMYRQVGPLTLNKDGLARRGVLVRHLLMPGFPDETQQILRFLADVGPGMYVNLMDQYYPAGKVSRQQYPELNRRLPAAEFVSAREFALQLGLRLDERRSRPGQG
jgi:putative pyruvate formate lyase activating enzyme